MKDAGAEETPDGDVVDEAIARQIALLWQTRPLRRERLYVADEIETALSYLRDSFLPVLPRSMRGGSGRWARGPGASCGRATGSAATGTAIPTSPPARCAARLPARPRPCSPIIWR